MQNALNEDYSAETEIFYSNHIPNPTSESNAESAREVAEEYGTATDFFLFQSDSNTISESNPESGCRLETAAET